MRTTALFARSTLIWRARSRRTAWASWPGWTRTLENWLAANHALRTLSRTTLPLHGSCSRSAMHRSPLWGAGRSGTRRWRGVNRTRAGLRCDHSSLLHNRLARYRLGRRRRTGSSLLTCCCHWRRSGCLRLCGGRSNHYCWRMCGRDNHNCGRCGRLFNWRRRNHNRRHWLDHGRCNHNTSFRCWSSRFGDYNSWFFCCLRCCGRRARFHGRRRSNGCCGCCRRPGRWRGRMLLLLLSLSEQPCYVARFGNLGEVDLRFDLGSGRSLSRR